MKWYFITVIGMFACLAAVIIFGPEPATDSDQLTLTTQERNLIHAVRMPGEHQLKVNGRDVYVCEAEAEQRSVEANRD